MVKTRNQKQTTEKDEERLKTIQMSKVCCTTPPPSSAKKRPVQPPTSAFGSQKKKKRLMFAPEPPQEFLFELTSPPARRLHSHHEQVHDSVVRIEFEMRGAAEQQPPREITERERNMYREWTSKDLKKELEALHGFNCDNVADDVAALKERLELAETLRRRSEIRRIPGIRIPNEMNLKDIQKALCERRIAFANLSHFKASEALERALIKEDAEGLVGEGYQFGRRMVSAADLFAYWQPSDKDMKEMLQQKGVTVPRKKAEKLDLLVRAFECEKEHEARKAVKDEMLRELRRRSIEFSSDDFTALFEAIYTSNKWRDNYNDLDNTPLEVSDYTPGCIIV